MKKTTEALIWNFLRMPLLSNDSLLTMQHISLLSFAFRFLHEAVRNMKFLITIMSR
jgi:hypothetical protein